MTSLTCDRCGDAVDTRDREGNGPCCHDLPQPWHRGEDGLYNRVTAPDAYFEDEDEYPEEEEEEEEDPEAWCRDAYLDESRCDCDRSAGRPRDRMSPHRMGCSAIRYG